MAKITEYKNKGKAAYKGFSVCTSCKKEFKLDTTDKSLFDNSLCFICFMNEEHGTEVKEI